MTPINYCANRVAHLNCSAVINGKGEGIVSYLGVDYSFEDFNAVFPISTKKVEVIPSRMMKGKNPDGTREWMED